MNGFVSGNYSWPVSDHALPGGEYGGYGEILEGKNFTTDVDEAWSVQNFMFDHDTNEHRIALSSGDNSTYGRFSCSQTHIGR